MSIVSPTNVAEQSGVYVFPSSSSNDIGKLLSESNLRDISGKITTRNYKSSESDFNLAEISGGISVTSGIATINGYRVVMPKDFEIALVGDDFTLSAPTKFNINLKIAKQSSTSGYIADTSDSSDYGVVFIDFTPDDNSPKTMKEYYQRSGTIVNDYKPSEQRLSDIGLITDANSVGTFQDFDETDLITSVTDENYSALAWIINKDNSLFVSDLAYKTGKVNVLTLNKSELNYNPTLSLTLGYVVLSKTGDTLNIDEISTYDCTRRIDIDETFFGDQTLIDYILDRSNCFLKQYGANTITSVRTPESGTTGILSKVPYISVIDSLLYNIYNLSDDTSVDSGKTYYTYNSETHRYTVVTNPSGNPSTQGYYERYISDNYMYMPVTYMGESYNEDVETHAILSDTDITKAIIECSFNSVPNENNADNEIYGSRILSVAGANDCYTAYGYNLINQEYDDTADDFVNKVCKTNQYFIGIKDAQSYLYPEGATGITKPPFGLYNDNASVLLKEVIENGTNKDIVEELASKILLSTFTMYNPSNTEYNAFEVDNNDVSYNMYKRHNGYIEVSSTATYDPNTQYYYIDTTTQEYTLYTGDGSDWDPSETTYFTYGEVTDKLSAGFKTITENNVTKPAVVFANGDKSSSISLADETDTDQNTPVIKFSDSIKVTGYVRAQRVYNAVYNDYAEWYESSNAKNIEAGDIIYYNPEKDEYDNHYKSSKTVIGICSEDFGYIVGGEDVSPEENREKFIPVSLCGRVPVKVNDTSEFKAGDFIYANGSNIGSGIGADRDRIGKFIKAVNNNIALVQVYLG